MLNRLLTYGDETHSSLSMVAGLFVCLLTRVLAWVTSQNRMGKCLLPRVSYPLCNSIPAV